MHMKNVDAANRVSNWGLVELSFTSYYLLRNSCYSYEANSKSCKTPTHFEALILYMSIYQIALGNGGYQPAMTAFGADQFDAESLEEQNSKMAFFSYFFVANNVGSLFSDIVLTYLQDKGRWALSFAFSAAASFLGVILFFSGTLHFRYFNPGGNPLVRISQVIVASVENRMVKAPQAEYLYEDDGKNCSMRKIVHTPEFKCLDKAAVVLHPALSSESMQKVSSKQWAPCTVTQVEEVKCILRLFPIWICTVVYSIAYNQMSSVFIEQGEAMNKAVSNLQIPPGSMNVFEILGVSGFIVLYQFCISPFMLKVLKKDLTELQRMGIGFIVSVVAMFSAGLVEIYRLKHQRVCANRCKASSSLSILWQMPQYVLVGGSEVFTYVGMMEFFNKESPDGLKSFASALYVASMSAGSFLSELIVTVIIKASGKESRESWIADNLNHGRMDNFYFLIGLLNVLGFILFVLCAKRYRGIQFAGHNDENENPVIKGSEDGLGTNGDEEVTQIEEIEVYLEA
ncbi:Protein NRT1/ PTR FAMILY 5.1 [Rhynchospora pubera]|uniref:Protein NRT1/ PTR FAMILY 5.1 n=1 Tax=Rhynchospora pubera TaxID=906938 RepID=A0AAV8F1H7_9POAL|nr:Protein NRT1/ PTR FAMILY 5.1 [Rhynchospora pubera]